MGESCGLCLWTQLLQGAEECWNILLDLGSSEAAAALLPCPELGMCSGHSAGSGAGHRGGSCWQQQELEGEGGQDKVLSLPWHSSAALLLCQEGPELLRSALGLQEWWGWESLTQLHVESCCGCRRLSQEGVALNPCYLS